MEELNLSQYVKFADLTNYVLKMYVSFVASGLNTKQKIS